MKMSKIPKEDAADKAERARERRMSLLERRRAAQRNAADMTTDVSRVYGLGGLRNLGMTGTAAPNGGRGFPWLSQ